MSSSMKHLILLGTHEVQVFGVVFDEQAKTLTHTTSYKTAEQPSWITQHPSKRDIVYVNGWVDGKAFACRVVDDKGNLEQIAEATTGGAGPTHIAVLEDESAIILAHYGAGMASLIPLNPDGTFASTSQTHSIKGDYTTQSHPRQEASHMHHVVVHDGEVFVPDLGANVVWRYSVDRESGFKILGKLDGFEPGDGPRHMVIHRSGKYTYTLCELSSYLVTHELLPNHQSRVISRFSILPPADEPHHREKMLACEIVLLPPLAGSGPSLLICSNRDSPNPEGDALALFSVSPDGEKVERAPQPWIIGVGKHLRAVAPSKDNRWVCVTGRNGGGVVMFERVGKDGLELKGVARLEELELTTVPVWV